MSKKNKTDLLAIEELSRYDPFVQKLAQNLYWDNVHIFDSKTHRLRSICRDRAQARVVLMLVDKMGKLYGKMRRLNADERKCLAAFIDIGSDGSEKPSSEK